MSLSFDHPMVLTLLAVLPVVVALAWHARWRRRQALVELGQQNPVGPRRFAQLFGWLLIVALLTVAASGPRWGPGPPLPTKPGVDAILAVDLSRSMLAQDALPNRLERGKEALNDLIEEVQAHGGHRLGVVAFAGQAQIVCPLTHDYEHARTKVARLSAELLPPALASHEISGTRIGAGLTAAVGAHDRKFRGAQIIVLVSDGDDPATDEEWRNGITAARTAVIPVYTVGIGDAANESRIPFNDALLAFRGVPVKSRLHEAPLRDIAAQTGGIFISRGVMKPALGEFVRQTMSQHATRESVSGLLPQAAPRQMWFLVPALLIAFFLMLPQLTWRPRWATAGAAVMLLAAADPSDRELRRGVAALDAGQFEQALIHFANAGERTTDPGLVAFDEGIALYHLGRFREAEWRFRWSLSDAAGSRRANALYNLGCALLQQSQGRHVEPLKNAVAALEQSLAVDEIESEIRRQAEENLALAKQMLAQLRPESRPGGDAVSDPAAHRPAADSIREATNSESGKADSKNARVTADGKTDGNRPQLTDRPPPPGKGSLPPLADDDALTPLTKSDAQAHLEKATARIAAARAAQLKAQAAPPATQFPDW
jgi:Ca-activated chloride channel family protein